MNFKEVISVSLILFSIIDILGNLPVVISLKSKGYEIKPGLATLASGLIMIIFLFLGEGLLKLFGVDINSFAVAGAIVIFIMGLEMVLGIDIFKQEPDINSASVFPIAFPMIAGAGALTTILTLRAEYEVPNIMLGIIINLLIVLLVLKTSDFLQRILGVRGVSILRKVFGIVLLAIAVKLFKTNLLA